MHAYRHRGRPELKLTVRALHRSSSRIPTVWCTLGPGSGRSPPFCVPTHAYLPRAFLRPSQRAEAHPIRRRVLGRVPRGGTHRITEHRVEMSVRVLLMSVAVASGSAFCVSPNPQLPARRSTSPGVPAQCHRSVPELGEGVSVSTHECRIVETKVDPHSHFRATRLRLLALALPLHPVPSRTPSMSPRPRSMYCRRSCGGNCRRPLWRWKKPMRRWRNCGARTGSRLRTVRGLR